MIKEISKCEESVFTCPYCHGSGSVKGWSPNQKGSVTYPGSKHGCNQCEGIGKLKSIVEGKLKIEITKLPLVPLFIIKVEINLFHKKGGPANVGTVITLDWGEINIENTEYFGKMGHTLNNEKHLLKKYSRFMIQKNVEPRISFDIFLSAPDVSW